MSHREKQFKFNGQGFAPTRPDHGGKLGEGKRKTARPFSHKLAIHAVMRSESAQGRHSMLSRMHKGPVYLEIDRTARESNLRLYRYVNVGNHLHMLVQAKQRQDLQRFLRVLAGRVAMRVTGARKGKPLTGKFWTRLAYTRLVEWGRPFTNALNYEAKNFGEAQGKGARFISDRIDFLSIGPPLNPLYERELNH